MSKLPRFLTVIEITISCLPLHDFLLSPINIL